MAQPIDRLEFGGASHGTMTCATCNKPVELGSVHVVRETYKRFDFEGYRTFHIHCIPKGEALVQKELDKQKKKLKRAHDEYYKTLKLYEEFGNEQVGVASDELEDEVSVINAIVTKLFGYVLP